MESIIIGVISLTFTNNRHSVELYLIQPVLWLSFLEYDFIIKG
jgi:hypothetical protein